MSDDSDPFDPDDPEMLGRLLNRMRRLAVYWCHNDVEAAEELLQEASLRLHRVKPWKRKEYSTYGGVIAWVTVVIKNIRKKGYTKQARRDALRAQVEEKFGNPVNEVGKIQDGMFKESVVKALKNVPAFSGNEEIQRFIQYQFVEDWTHAEIGEALGKTGRQLTKFKGKFYDAIPKKLLPRLFDRIRNKK
jgi:RNA polymerase sigma factor (sigma-70 family)